MLVLDLVFITARRCVTDSAVSIYTSGWIDLDLSTGR